MKVLRVVFAVVFFLLVVAGFWKWSLAERTATEEKKSLPFWEHLQERFSSFSEGDENTTKDDDDEMIVDDSGETGDDDEMIVDDTDNEKVNELHPDFSTGILSLTQMEGVLQGGYLSGPEDADVVMIQYCDYGVTYCQQANEQDVLGAYRQAFEGHLQTLLKPFPKTMDERGTLLHRAAWCALGEGNTKAIETFEKLLYQQPENMDASVLEDIAYDLDIAGMRDCLDENHATVYLSQQTKRAKDLFAISSLPTYIILHKQTGQYIKLPGLYSFEEVIETISTIFVK